jgi:hypothetical protein
LHPQTTNPIIQNISILPGEWRILSFQQIKAVLKEHILENRLYKEEGKGQERKDEGARARRVS